MTRKWNRILLIALFLPWSAGARSRLEEFGLVLRTPAVARQIGSRAELQSARAARQRQSILAEQAGLKAELARRGFRVAGAVQTLVNAVFVLAPREREAELRSLPGVVDVSLIPPLHRTLDQAVTLVHVPEAWNALGGPANAGAGIKIGILDTGIDPNHAAFQDPALQVPAGFPKGRTQDLAYTNHKVIVARSYVAQLSDPDPRYSTPDDTSPRDRSGHGTAVAMIAAGNTNSGPAATITGVAPKAWLGNYKIFGTPGINDLTFGDVVAQALQDAFQDGMDIVVLPTGDQPVYGPLAQSPDCGGVCDQRAFAMEQAVETATQNGMLVVISAGNEGDIGAQTPTLNTIDTPGIAPSALTVGATTNAHIFFSTLHVPNFQDVNAVMGDGPRIDGTLTAPLRDVSSLQDDGHACAALANGSLTGAIALIQRGNCDFSVKIINSQNAGAVGVVIYQLDGLNLPTSMATQGTTVPAMMIGNSDGVALKQFLQANSGASGTMDPALRAVSAQADTVADFSSRGPSIGDAMAIKPEVAAVGTDLYTAAENSDPNGDLYDPSGYTAVSGTSFAAAMVGGAAALVKQQNPGFRPAQLKSALVNTATTDVTGANGQARVTSVGAGKLNAGAAVAVGATVEPSTLSFGALGSASLPINRTLRITNTGNASVTYSLSVQQRDPDNHTQMSVSPSSLPLGPGQNQQVTVTLSGSQPSAGSYEGAIAISGGGTNLRVPYLYLASDGVPYNIAAIKNGSFTGIASDPQYYVLVFRVTDRFGVPVPNSPVQFKVVSGGGSFGLVDATTDRLGIAAAQVYLGPQLSTQTFTGTAGGLTTEFDASVRPFPTIASGGVVNAASNQAGQGLAPGSYITIYGAGFSDTPKAESTASLPLVLSLVSVSFDAPGLSLPGRLWSVSPSQVNVQIPWEFQGLSSVQMKVAIGGFLQSALYTVPLNNYSPAAFEYTDPAGGQQLAAVLDQNNALVTPANPAKRGQVIQIAANGVGPLTNQPATGEPSPAQPLAQTRVTPTVTIGGVNAPVQFSGLTPGAVGLYQINVTVPPDAPTGTQPLIISAGGVNSKPANLPVQ